MAADCQSIIRVICFDFGSVPRLSLSCLMRPFALGSCSSSDFWPPAPHPRQYLLHLQLLLNTLVFPRSEAGSANTRKKSLSFPPIRSFLEDLRFVSPDRDRLPVGLHDTRSKPALHAPPAALTPGRLPTTPETHKQLQTTVSLRYPRNSGK